MKVVRFMIRNYRSIKEEIIDHCGGFNILIGKNNSCWMGLENTLADILDIKPQRKLEPVGYVQTLDENFRCTRKSCLQLTK